MEQVGVTSKPAAKPAPQFTAEDVTDAPAAPCEGSPARLAGDAGDQVRFMLAGKALVTVVSGFTTGLLVSTASKQMSEMSSFNSARVTLTGTRALRLLRRCMVFHPVG
jgi:hypothetical protein